MKILLFLLCIFNFTKSFPEIQHQFLVKQRNALEKLRNSAHYVEHATHDLSLYKKSKGRKLSLLKTLKTGSIEPIESLKKEFYENSDQEEKEETMSEPIINLALEKESHENSISYELKNAERIKLKLELNKLIEDEVKKEADSKLAQVSKSEVSELLKSENISLQISDFDIKKKSEGLTLKPETKIDMDDISIGKDLGSETTSFGKVEKPLTDFDLNEEKTKDDEKLLEVELDEKIKKTGELEIMAEDKLSKDEKDDDDDDGDGDGSDKIEDYIKPKSTEISLDDLKDDGDDKIKEPIKDKDTPVIIDLEKDGDDKIKEPIKDKDTPVIIDLEKDGDDKIKEPIKDKDTPVSNDVPKNKIEMNQEELEEKDASILPTQENSSKDNLLTQAIVDSGLIDEDQSITFKKTITIPTVKIHSTKIEPISISKIHIKSSDNTMLDKEDKNKDSSDPKVVLPVQYKNKETSDPKEIVPDNKRPCGKTDQDIKNNIKGLNGTSVGSTGLLKNPNENAPLTKIVLEDGRNVTYHLNTPDEQGRYYCKSQGYVSAFISVVILVLLI